MFLSAQVFSQLLVLLVLSSKPQTESLDSEEYQLKLFEDYEIPLLFTPRAKFQGL